MFRKLKEEGMSVRTIAKRYGVSRNTVRKYMNSRILPKYTRKKRGSSIDAYKAGIMKKLTRHIPHPHVFYKCLHVFCTYHFNLGSA